MEDNEYDYDFRDMESFQRKKRKILFFFKNQPLEFLYRMSYIKWKCIERRYMRIGEDGLYYGDYYCPFCFNSCKEDAICNCLECKIDKEICEDRSREGIISFLESDVPLSITIKKIVKKLKENYLKHKKKKRILYNNEIIEEFLSQKIGKLIEILGEAHPYAVGDMNLTVKDILKAFEDLVNRGVFHLDKCPKCKNNIEETLVLMTEKPFMSCGQCGLIFDNYPKEIKFFGDEENG